MYIYKISVFEGHLCKKRKKNTFLPLILGLSFLSETNGEKKKM